MEHSEDGSKRQVHSTKCTHKILQRSHISHLTAHLKAKMKKLHQKSRRQQNKHRAEINKIETNKQNIKKINKTKS